MIFRSKPIEPIMSTSLGESTTCRWTNRSSDWRHIDSANAKRNTPLKKAPMQRFNVIQGVNSLPGKFKIHTDELGAMKSVCEAMRLKEHEGQNRQKHAVHA